jgi:GT2 family glycosyltransferase
MRPLPIDYPIVRLLDKLLRWLPRASFEAAPAPLHDVVQSNAAEHLWRATGDDPAFQLTGALQPGNKPRWYYVEGYLLKRSSTQTKLYVNTGAGCSEEHAFAIPVTRRGYVREVLRLPPGVVGLRLDPTEAEGSFVFEWMNLQAISPLEAGLRRLARVLFDWNRFSNQAETRQAAQDKLAAPLLQGDLATAYLQSAQMRIPARGNESATELWRNYQDRLTASLPVLRVQAAAVPGQPLISVLVPTYNTPPALLQAMLESVRNQLYTQWELVVWDDASPQAATRQLVADAAVRDPRIRAFASPSNAGVARTTNRALREARGDYVVLLDHDDALEPQALLRIAQCAAGERPDFIYSDEAIVTADGDEVLDLALRPAFSLEYFRHHPYIVHLLAFKRTFLLQLEGLDERLQISQDVDLILRAAEHAAGIAHIPEVLYRWRTLQTSAGHEKKNQVSAATVEVLQRHLQRCGEAGVVAADPQTFNYYQPRYEIPAGTKVAVIIPTKNHHALVRQCVESLERTTGGLDVELVIVDHDSSDPESLAYFDSLRGRHTVLRHSGPFNFSSINNAAVRQLKGRHSHLLFCNNDVEALEPGWLHTMLGLAGRPGVGIVGAHLVYGDQVGVQHAGVGVGMFGAAEHFGKFMPHLVQGTQLRNTGYRGSLVCAREVSAVTAACLLMRRACFDAINGFDEQLAVGFGDIDLCLRAVDKGWRVLQSGGSVLVHHESKTRGTSNTDPHPEDSARYVARWKATMTRGDPYFHPLFSELSTMWLYRQPLPVQLTPAARLWQPAATTVTAAPAVSPHAGKQVKPGKPGKHNKRAPRQPTSTPATVLTSVTE